MLVDKKRLEERLIEEALREWARLRLVRVDEQPLYYGEARADAAVVRPLSMYRALYSAAVYESSGAFTVNSSETIVYSGDKALAYSRLASHGIPIPRTLYASTPTAALKVEADETLVLKPPIGSWGRLVSRARNKDELEHQAVMRSLLPCATQRNTIIQEYIPNGGYDVRCIYIGGEVIGCIKRYKPAGEWRTNVALGGRVEKLPLNGELEELTIKTAEAVKGFFVSIDILESKKGLLVNEVNGVPEFKGFLKATGKNPAIIISEKLKNGLRK